MRRVRLATMMLAASALLVLAACGGKPIWKPTHIVSVAEPEKVDVLDQTIRAGTSLLSETVSGAAVRPSAATIDGKRFDVVVFYSNRPAVRSGKPGDFLSDDDRDREMIEKFCKEDTDKLIAIIKTSSEKELAGISSVFSRLLLIAYEQNVAIKCYFTSMDGMLDRWDVS